jgi:hypothetical protein
MQDVVSTSTLRKRQFSLAIPQNDDLGHGGLHRDLLHTGLLLALVDWMIHFSY